MTPIVINILDLSDMGGSDVIEHKLATFSSPKNPEIEDFLEQGDKLRHRKAIHHISCK